MASLSKKSYHLAVCCMSHKINYESIYMDYSNDFLSTVVYIFSTVYRFVELFLATNDY